MFAAAQLGLLALLTLFGDGGQTGEYVFALSTTAPIFLMFDLCLRVTRSTDHRHQERYRTYLAIRFYCLIGALLTTLVMVTWFFPNRFWVFAGICLYRTGDSISNLSFGGFQRMQRADLIGRSLTPKGIIAIAMVALVAWLSGGNATIAAFAMGLLTISWALFFDLPGSWKLNEPEQPLSVACMTESALDFQSIFRISKRSLPLGFDAFVASLALNSPKYCIEYYWGSAALGVFGLLFQLAFSIQMLIGAVGHTGVSILSESFRDQKPDRFWRLLNRMLFSSMAVGVLATIVGTLVIPTTLGFILGPEYNQPLLVFLLLLGSTLAGTQRTAGRATQACGNYFWYTAFDIIICLGSLTTSLLLVKSLGLSGGALGIVIGFTLGLTVTLIHTYGLLWRHQPSGTSDAAVS